MHLQIVRSQAPISPWKVFQLPVVDHAAFALVGSFPSDKNLVFRVPADVVGNERADGHYGELLRSGKLQPGTCQSAGDPPTSKRRWHLGVHERDRPRPATVLEDGDCPIHLDSKLLGRGVVFDDPVIVRGGGGRLSHVNSVRRRCCAFMRLRLGLPSRIGLPRADLQDPGQQRPPPTSCHHDEM